MKRFAYALALAAVCSGAITPDCRAQASLLLVGGGAEDDGSWSDAPYGDAVALADSGVVAIVGASPASGWLPAYFESLGARRAANYPVANAVAANQEALYDSLRAADLIFFRGGDQWTYLQAYAGSRLEDAVRENALEGKVIGGTSAGCAILSGWVFSAENGTVYPEEALEDPFNPYLTLRPGPWTLAPDWIFDTHFTERGRQGRMPGFLARLRSLAGAPVRGLGVDDRTAVLFGPDGTGRVYGSGTVSTWRLDGPLRLDASGRLRLDSLVVGQARHGDRIRLADGRVWRAGGTPADLRAARETGPATVWLGSAAGVAQAAGLLEAFAGGLPAGGRVLLLAPDGAYRNAVRNALLARGVAAVDGVAPDADATALAGLLDAADAVLLARNGAVLHAWRETPNGRLADSLFRAGLPSIWLGGDARFAGRVVIEGYDAPLASYTGAMERRPGFGLLGHTVVLPEAWADGDRAENVAGGLAWAMTAEGCRHGLALHGDAWVQGFRQADAYRLRAGGFPALWWTLDSTRADTLSALLPGASAPRQMGAFGETTLQVLADTTLTVGRETATPTGPVRPSWPQAEFAPGPPLPNPFTGLLRWPDAGSGRLEAFGPQGRILGRWFTRGARTLDTGDWPAGPVLLRFTDAEGRGRTWRLWHAAP
jgi:cyanophycinase